MTGLRLQILPLRPGVAIPRYATDGAAGLDLSAALPVPVVIEPGAFATIPTGFVVVLPKGHEGQVRPRSGLAARHGVTVLNSPGTIDEDYRGEVKVILVNHGSEPFEIHDGDRIAQLVVAPVTRVSVEVVSAEVVDATSRGDGGFGSTGRR
ncbi:MAG: dUTP diphosphatase [Polyangiales bacterium]